MLWCIAKAGPDRTVTFAAEELKKYIGRMDASQEVAIMRFPAFDPEIKNVLWLGVCPEIASLVADSRLDDAIDISVNGGTGAIRGANPRSVLIGVYRFLRELGCAWVRPGADGEIIPSRSLDDVSVSLREIPSYRHRAVCIEGAVNYDHVTDMIDWLPKVGMNGYFNQFYNPVTFYDRWYSHTGNPLLPKTPLSPAVIRGLRDQSLENLSKRGMLVHMAGHGWTCEPFGVPGESWDTREYDITPEQACVMAQVNGVRGLWHGIPLNTNLCYSDPAVRARVVDAVAAYCRDVPETDILHIWLADDSNNHCECAECVKKRPSDWYLTLLNEIDARLTAEGLPQKIVFANYMDLLWRPIETTFNNPDRFILMFAPITRTYSRAFTDCEKIDGTHLPPYVRNRLTFPSSVGENLAYLRTWQELFTGDSFDFDYHFMWDHLKDPGYTAIAKTLFCDMQHLDEVGLNGMLSCQAQRVWLPSGLGMTAMAAALWDKNASFDDVATAYFSAAFGKDGVLVQAYLSDLSDAFDPAYIRREKPAVDPVAAARFRAIPFLLNGFSPVIEANASDPSLMENQRRSWQYLLPHAEICRLLSDMLAARAEGDEALKEACRARLYACVDQKEKELAHVFDAFEFKLVYDQL